MWYNPSMKKGLENLVEFIERRKHSSRSSTMPVAHFHTKHELYFLEQGKTKYFIGNELYILAPEDFIFVPKGEFHQTDGEMAPNIERVVLMFDDEFIGQEYAEVIQELTQHKHIHIPKEHIAKLRNLIQKMEAEEADKPYAYREMQKSYLRELLIWILRYRQTELPKKHLSEMHQIIDSATQYISENCHEDLSLEGLAQRYALSPYYFSKLFKETTGIGLSHYINIARISLSMRLLARTKLSIDEIAVKCGFHYTSYFIQTFKKLIGTTPKQYALTSIP